MLFRSLGSEGIFYAEILAWFGADVILITSYVVQMRRMKRKEPD